MEGKETEASENYAIGVKSDLLVPESDYSGVEVVLQGNFITLVADCVETIVDAEKVVVVSFHAN